MASRARVDLLYDEVQFMAGCGMLAGSAVSAAALRDQSSAGRLPVPLCGRNGQDLWIGYHPA
jgi:hypothetical protein